MRAALLALAVACLPLPARAQAASAPTLEAPIRVMPWGRPSLPIVDWQVHLATADIALCASWHFRDPDDRWAGWKIATAARVMPLDDSAPWMDLLASLWRQDGAALTAQRTHRLDSPLLQPIAKACAARARASVPAGPWVVAGGSGSAAGTRPVFAVAGSASAPALGLRLPDRATVGERVDCANPARRVVLATGSVYCWSGAASGVTLSREVP